MNTFSEQMLEIRIQYCEQCNKEYTEKELREGKHCDICKEARELGRTVASLQD